MSEVIGRRPVASHGYGLAVDDVSRPMQAAALSQQVGHWEEVGQLSLAAGSGGTSWDDVRAWLVSEHGFPLAVAHMLAFQMSIRVAASWCQHDSGS